MTRRLLLKFMKCAALNAIHSHCQFYKNVLLIVCSMTSFPPLYAALCKLKWNTLMFKHLPSTSCRLQQLHSSTCRQMQTLGCSEFWIKLIFSNSAKAKNHQTRMIMMMIQMQHSQHFNIKI